jgi:photosystem II stability/assembly factor-like uncharacterized protein
MGNYTLAKTSLSRVFTIEGRAAPGNVPVYQSCMRMLSPTQNFGDIERVEVPDPDNYDKFIEAAQIRGAAERVTTSIEGRYALELISDLLRMAKNGCSIDAQLHMGICTDPSDFNTFKKIVVLENAQITSWTAEDLGALQSDDNAAINETAELSAELIYEIVPLIVQSVASTTVTNEIVDVFYCDSVNCGECEDSSDGCQKVYAITKAAGGSPGTPADVVFSIDGGTTWFADDIDTLGAAEDPTAATCLGNYLVVVSNDSASLHYALKSEFNGYTDPTFTEVTTGFVAGGEPNDISTIGRYSYVVGDGGYVYGTADPTGGVSVLNAGEAVVDDLLRVHAISSTFAVAVGKNGAVIWTENGSIFGASSRPVGVGINLTALFVKSETEWWVGTSDGQIFYTLNKGTTWTAKTFSGSGTGVVHDIVAPTGSVMYMSHATTAPAGRLFRSYDGGYSWNILPEGTSVTPANDQINRIGVCVDANKFIGGGLADDASDGIMVIGQPE